jgi:hypothetical protein
MLQHTQADRSDALPAYRLRCFRATQLHDAAGVDCTPRARKTRALLIYVLLARSAAISRERLAALLWAHHGDEQARASVRQALYELKPLSSGPAPLLKVTRTHVSANDIGVALDIDRADSLAQAAELTTLTELLANTSLTLFADLDDLTPEFDDWLRAERGVELSVSGEVAGRASIAVGAVLMKPRVEGELVQSGAIGERPVGQTNRSVSANGEYRFASLRGFSIDTDIVSYGPRVAPCSPRAGGRPCLRAV